MYILLFLYLAYNRLFHAFINFFFLKDIYRIIILFILYLNCIIYALFFFLINLYILFIAIISLFIKFLQKCNF
jgi:hypothetical protein